MRNLARILPIGIVVLLLLLSIDVCCGLEDQEQSGLNILNLNDIPEQNSEVGDLSTIQLPFTEQSKNPVIRYPNALIHSDLKEIIEYLDFQADTSKKGQVFIYFKQPVGTATVDLSYKIAAFLMSRDDWKGDRSLESVAAEIYIHWIADNAKPLFQNNSFSQGLWEQMIIGSNDPRPSPLYPTHLGYYYSGLDKTNAMDAFLLTL